MCKYIPERYTEAGLYAPESFPVGVHSFSVSLFFFFTASTKSTAPAIRSLGEVWSTNEVQS